MKTFQVKIQKIRENDLEALAELYKHFWNEDSNLKLMRSVFKRLEKDPNYVLLAAKLEDTLVGSAMDVICQELHGECKPFMIIEDVIVSNNNRRSGIGTALMQKLEKTAKDNNCSYTIFVTEKERKEAQQFYKSLGYKTDSHVGFKKKMR